MLNTLTANETQRTNQKRKRDLSNFPSRQAYLLLWIVVDWLQQKSRFRTGRFGLFRRRTSFACVVEIVVGDRGSLIRFETNRNMREPAFIRVLLFFIWCIYYTCISYSVFSWAFFSDPQAEKLLLVLHRGQCCWVTHNLG